MKSILKSLMSVAVATLAFTSCSNDATEDVMPNVGSKTLEVTATIDQTRTTLDKNHINLMWAEKEQIHLYIGETATKAHDIDPVTGGKITGVTYDEKNDKVYAYYSIAASVTSKDAKHAVLNIPTYQKQTAANVFEGKNMPMAASGTIENGKVNLAFQPLGCVLVFNVYGPAQNEKIKSIKFEAAKCGGYDNTGCDLTADPVQYKPFENSKSVMVELPEGAYAPIADAKPDNTTPNGTQLGSGNQVYLVVAQAEYPAGSKFIVTTDAGTYTFTTKNALDCSSTARVVNLNLANAEGFTSEIVVPTVSEQSAEAADGLSITGIEFRHFTEEQIATATATVYGNADHTGTADWLTIVDNAELSASGRLYYSLAANTETTPRTAYIVIECNGVTSDAIAITQVGAGSEPAVTAVATYTPSADTAKGASLDNGDVTLAFSNAAYYNPALRCYKNSTITVTSTTTITKIEFVRTHDSDDKGTLSANVGTLSGSSTSDYAWTGENNEVKLTVNNAQFRIESIKITYVESKEPKIKVPTVDPQPAEGGEFPIQGIELKYIDNVADVTTGVYSDAELTQPLDGAWLQILSAAELASGKLTCNVAANDKSERTAYIGIKYTYTDAQGAQQVAKAAIPVTQSASASAVLDTVAELSTIINGGYGPHSNDTWTVTCGGNTHTLGSNTSNDSKCNLKGYTALAEAMGLSVSDRAAAVISKKVLPAGYNTVKLEYSKTNNDMFVGIAFSPDGVNWTKIKDFVELKETSSAGSQTYSFPQQEAGCYAFVIKSNTNGMRIQTCKITYSQK